MNWHISMRPLRTTGQMDWSARRAEQRSAELFWQVASLHVVAGSMCTLVFTKLSNFRNSGCSFIVSSDTVVHC